MFCQRVSRTPGDENKYVGFQKQSGEKNVRVLPRGASGDHINDEMAMLE